MACYDAPELIHDILATIGDTVCRVLERAVPAGFDQLGVHEDMAGRSGPLFGPRQVREFVAPYYRRAWDLAREGGARLFRQDSDGDMTPVIGEFLEAGINFMYPVEPVGAQDLLAVRERWGERLALMGGIDKHVLRRGLAAIDAELERVIPPMVRSGGCILALDHRIPNGTPLEAYRHYVRRAWELMGAAEAGLRDMGCPKVNLQVRAGNREVVRFYRRVGYEVEDLASLGKELLRD